MTDNGLNFKNEKKYSASYRVFASEMTRLAYNDYRGWQLPSDENPDDPGFILQDADDYITWLPVDKFNERFNLIDG